jgi:hypothetical protein
LSNPNPDRILGAMKSRLRGEPISVPPVLYITARGLWLLLDGRELFASFRDFPWLADGTVRQLTRIERPRPDHLYWPELDVDLAVESLEHPERFPLKSKSRSKRGRGVA